MLPVVLLWDRRCGGVGVAWGRWVVYACFGRPVWWVPRWAHELYSWCEHWYVGWLVMAVGLLRYRHGFRWPVLRCAGKPPWSGPAPVFGC